MTPDQPPPNRAVGCYRMVIWLMPTSVAISCMFAIDWIHRWSSMELDRAAGISIGLTFFSMIVLGWIEPKFDRRWDGQSERSIPTAVMRFFLLQMIIVPFVLLVVMFGAILIFGF
jgi:hypothetical protein